MRKFLGIQTGRFVLYYSKLSGKEACPSAEDPRFPDAWDGAKRLARSKATYRFLDGVTEYLQAKRGCAVIGRLFFACAHFLKNAVRPYLKNKRSTIYLWLKN